MSKRARKVAFSNEVQIADKRRREDGEEESEGAKAEKSQYGAHQLE